MFEYKVVAIGVSGPSIDQADTEYTRGLNSWGERGWDLVSVVPVGPNLIRAIFRKEKQETHTSSVSKMKG